MSNERLTVEQMRELVKKRLGKGRGSQVTLAKEFGITPQYLSDILSGKRLPGKRVSSALGYIQETTYRRV